MRRIVMFNQVGVDGSFSDAEGGLGWAKQDPQIQRDAAGSTNGFDTILFGRRTYEMFAAFWPHVGPSSPNPHGSGPLPPEMLAMADMLNASQKVVYSRTLEKATWRNTRIEPALDADAVQAMKRGSGKDIIVFGSGTIVSQLTEHGLIDEYQIVVNPIALASGKPLFAALGRDARFELLGAKAYPSGIAMLRYGPAK
jgi:dihydrofolate reductase